MRLGENRSKVEIDLGNGKKGVSECHLSPQEHSKNRSTTIFLEGLGRNGPLILLIRLCPGTVRKNPSLSKVVDVL